MNKIIAVLVGLTLMAAPALACVGPSCPPQNDGSIDTAFTGSGWNVWFADSLAVDECFSDTDMIVENVDTMFGKVSVLQNVDIEDKWFGPTEVVLNAQIAVDPWMFATANVETYADWDYMGSVYRAATLGDVTSIVSAGASEGTFVDDIEYNNDVSVFKSIGLNTYNVCDLPDLPEMPTMPTCVWCVQR
jgi:hypothetical protein